MRVRRTGAKRGESPTWFIQASTDAEKAALNKGLLKNRSPSWRYPWVLVWGLQSKKAAERMVEIIKPSVEKACDLVERADG